MNIDEQLKILSRQTYPHQVDVVDAVMAQVRQRPYLRPAHRSGVWRGVALTAAAAVAALVVFNVASFRSYDEARIGDVMTHVSDYDYYASVESAAVNPIEYLYEDEIDATINKPQYR